MLFEKGIGVERESVLFCTKFSNNSMLKTTERSSRGLIYNMAESKSLTISCHFCQALISFKMATKDKFEKHMEVVHEVHLDFDLLLALHMLGEEERASLARSEGQDGEGIRGSQGRREPSQGGADKISDKLLPLLI